MREKRTFAERTQVFASDKTLKKYFLVYEGSETEAIYFDAVSSLREKMKINPLIEIIPIIRSYSEDGWSNPKKILDRVIENLEESRNNQYQYVIDKCEEMEFGLYVTNPCFEFWLLLHFDGVFELDREKLLKNPKVTAKRRYVEQELRRLWPGYKKSSYKAEKLLKDIDKAISNEKEFCEDVAELENCVGSNIGKLITDMRTQ